MFPFPGYHPIGYQPGQQPAPTAATFTERQRTAAIEAEAGFISADGGKCYRFRLGEWRVAEWDGISRYGSYFPMDAAELEEPGDRPAGAVKL